MWFGHDGSEKGEMRWVSDGLDLVVSLTNRRRRHQIQGVDDDHRKTIRLLSICTRLLSLLGRAVT